MRTTRFLAGCGAAILLSAGVARLWLDAEDGGGPPPAGGSQADLDRADPPDPGLRRRAGGPAPAAGPDHRVAAALVGFRGRSLLAVPDELLVRLAPSASPADVESALARAGATLLDSRPAAGYARLRVGSGALEAAADALESVGVALWAGPNAICVGAGSGSKPKYSSLQWNLERAGEKKPWKEGSGAGAVVAVLDSGIAYADAVDPSTGASHVRAAEFAATPIAAGYDFIDADPAPLDDHGHGTHMAASIAGLGHVSGLATAATLMPVRVLDGEKRGTLAGLVDGIYYAVDHGADVINMSLSFPAGYFPDPLLSDAVLYAAAAGVTMVAAAGNEGTAEVAYPAAFPDVIAVGASLRKGSEDDPTSKAKNVRAGYSSHGSSLDLVAPGGSLLLATKHDDLPDAILGPALLDGDPGTLAYYWYAGTSSAAAEVSGVAAGLVALGAGRDQVRSALLRTTEVLSEDGRYELGTGMGLVQMEGALDALAEGAAVALPTYRVDPVVLIVDEGSRIRAEGIVEVLDGNGAPAVGVRVIAQWLGTSAMGAEAITDGSGFARFTGPAVDEVAADGSATPFVAGLRVDTVVDPGTGIPVPPGEFYRLGDGLAAALESLMSGDGLASSTLLLFGTKGASEGWSELLGGATVIDAYVMKNLGPIQATGPMSVALNPSFLEVIDGTGLASSTLLVTFDSPKSFGSGLMEEISVEVLTGTGLASSTLALPLDRLLLGAPSGSGLASSTLLNLSGKDFLSQEFFGSGLASSTLGRGLASSTLFLSFGNGLASSTLTARGLASSTFSARSADTSDHHDGQSAGTVLADGSALDAHAE